MREIKVLDHGYVRLVEAWGHGDAGTGAEPDNECGIIEAARQSTQGSFRGWDDKKCEECGGFPDVYYEERKYNCTLCEGTGKTRGDGRLLKYLHNNVPQHATPSEFAGAVLEIKAPIFVIREWQRHRTHSVTDDEFSGDWAFNEMSARYAPLPKFDFIPDWQNLKERGERNTKNTQAKGLFPFNESLAKSWHSRLPDVYSYLEKVYNDALLAGVPKELARIVLPFGRYTQMRATAYLRNWLAFVTLRSHPDAQEEIRQYSIAVEAILAETFPRTWALFAAKRAGTPNAAGA